MIENQSFKVLVSLPSLYWVRDRKQILVVDERGQEIYSLHDIEAAVWTWLTFAYSYPKIVGLLAAMLAVPSAEAEGRLGVMLQAWHKAGILAVEAR